jgi:hypothetical protein
MKSYYFIVSLFAVIGIIIFFSEHPLIIGLSSFGIGISYKYMLPKEEDKDIID